MALAVNGVIYVNVKKNSWGKLFSMVKPIVSNCV